MNIEKKNRILKSLFWKFAERLGIQGIQFIIQIVLARLLSPSDYGILAIIVVFINIANVFVQKGFATSLVQKQTIDEADYSSAFFVGLIISILSYIALFAGAPLIARFYHNNDLVLYLRVLIIIVFPGAFNAIQNAIVERQLLFKELFSVSTKTVIISGAIGIFFAYGGYGVWSLIAQQLSYNFFICVLLYRKVQWRPRAVFSMQKAKRLFHFGSKLLVSSLINTIYRNLRSLIVGREFSSETLGYLNRAEQLPNLVFNNIDGSLQTVLFPVYSSEQDDKETLKALMRKAIKLSSYILFPMMLGLATIARPLIIILLTEKWLPCVGLMQILCFEFAFYPIHTANLQAINAVGRSDIFLKLEIFKKVLGIMILFLSVRFGVYGIATGSALFSFVATFINAYPNKKLLQYGYWQQIRDIFPSFAAACIMAIIVNCFTPKGLNVILLLFTKIITGIFVYILISFAFKLEEMNLLRKMVKDLMKNNQNKGDQI